jgi:hypothetical protein
LIVTLIIPLVVVVLIPLEAIPSIILLPLILCLLLPSLPCSLRPVHVVGCLIVVETKILRRRDSHSILLVVVVLPSVIGSSP